MDAFCGSRFWNSQAVWYTEDPDFTECFEKTVLVLVPCVFLWICLPFEIHFLGRSKFSDIPWNTYNISKLLVIVTLAAVSLTELVRNVFTNSSYFPVDLYSPLIKFLTFNLLFGLTYANVRYGRRSSAILFIFSLLSLLFGIVQCRTEFRLHWSQDVSSKIVNFIIHIIYYSAVLVLFLLNCFADSAPRNSPRPFDKNACPRNQSSFLSKMLFIWFEPMTWKGYRKSLENEDLWTLDYSISSSNIVPRFEKEWNKVLEKTKKTSDLPIDIKSKCEYKINHKIENASIMTALRRTFGLTFIMGTLLKIFVDVFVFVNPQILNLLIDFIGSNEPMWKGYTYAGLLFIIAVFQSVLSSQYMYIMSKIGIQIRACIISTVYKKALRTSNNARRHFTAGETVNLMTVDAYRFIFLLPFSYILISSPLQVVLTIYFLWQLMGPSSLAGFAVMIFSVLVNSYIASKIKSLQFKQMQKKDKRVKLMNQILSGIKMLKLYAWERGFEDQVLSIRNEEMKILRRQALLSGLNTFIWSCTSFMICLSTFAVYVLLSDENVLTPAIAFVSLSLFNILKLPLLNGPEMISNLIQTWVSVKRIDKFLNSEDMNFEDVTHEERSEALVIENGSFSWEGSRGSPVLRNINVKINPGALVAVVGPVGAGKSSLISAFLGEMCKISGLVNTKGTIAYVPQQAWIQNATLRDNVTFGEPVRSSYYNEVLEACALKPDLKILPSGDMTNIGERGINVSGGQKQRISLARAVYYDADVYLLDDPLSAVDSGVGKHIFKQVIGPYGLLRKKTRVLVTHSVSYLSQVDLIVVVKDGTISESGTFEQLLENKGDFSEFLVNYLEENQDCDNEDLDNLIDILDEKKLFTEKLIRLGSITSENGSIASFIRQRSIRNETRISLRKRSSVIQAPAKKELVEEENIESGNINWSVYAYFLRSAGYIVAFVMLLSNCLLQGLSVYSSLWLSIWTDSPNVTTAAGTQDPAERDYYLSIFTLLGFSKCVAEFMSSVSIRIACWNTAKILHDVMLSNIFRLPSSFMDVTPGGRILSRFSKDIDVLDNNLPDQISSTLFCFGDVICTLVIVSCSTPAFIYAIVPLTIIYYFIQRFYVATSRQLKRLESVSRSPIYSHFVETITGLQSVRAYGLSEKFIHQSEEKVDLNHQSFYLNVVSNRWLSVRSETICNLVVLLAALFAVLDRDTISPGLAGLSVGYTIMIAFTFSWSVYMASEVETNIVSIERIKEYSDTPQEAPWNLPNEQVPSKWPSKGEITFQDFKVRYREGLQLVLRGVSFSVNGGEKVGIVGRTGAGKSSLTLSLFRILESAGGRILIDGVDIASLGLHTLRSRLTIIPQDPVVFAGSLRTNLDPLGLSSDDDIWYALELAHLKPYISSLDGGLGHELIEGGENFSVGQKQLICLARALLRKTKILILDEATAAVDLETDDLIQTTIREEFSDCTILTIAHRLNTIMDYDKIIVLDDGKVAEFDSPKNLLETRNSIFYKMAADARLV